MKKKILSAFNVKNKLAFNALLFVGFFAVNFSLNAQTVTTIGQVLGNPSGIAVDAAGFVYIAERAPTTTITKLNQSTGLTSIFSSTGFNDPMDIAFGPNSELFVADVVSNSILKIPFTGGTATSYVTGADKPTGLAFDSDTLYYIEYTTQKIFKVLPGGGAVGSLNVIQISDSALWMSPGARGVSLTLLADGNLFVTAGLHYSQYIVNKTTGSIITEIYNESEGTIFGAEELSDGAIYMPGNSTNKIYKWSSNVTDSSPWFGNGTSDSVDGSDTIASFDSPYFMASDASDNLYVTDYTSKKIRKISNAVASTNTLENEFISIYPNPTSSFLKIELEEISDITIYSTDGKIVTQLNNASNYSIDATSFKNGVYYIQSTSGSTQKFIKQ